jgi:transposase
MAMGQRTHEQQAAMWVAVSELPQSVSHPFYDKVNRLLAEYGFDDFVETQCRPFYAEKMGRPSLAPGQYFRLLLLGYFEGLARNAASPGAHRTPRECAGFSVLC